MQKYFFLLWTLICLSLPAHASMPRPKLILTLVIDQFRADYLMRFGKEFLPAHGKNGEVGGFEYFMTDGAYFPYGQYDILESMTGPGHATILTGSYPYQAGIPLNIWYDHKTHSSVYCTQGESPELLYGTTVGDELKNADYPSRVVTVSLKDRAAILMGGHRADLALWYDEKNEEWVSSKYYLRKGKTPTWLVNFNHKPDSHATEETLTSPYGSDFTERFAETVFDTYHLGQRAATDLFAVSFSSHDYAGHLYGPNSREVKKMTISEDQAIARLLNHIRSKVPGGLKNVVIVLTGDHGIAPTPEWAASHRFASGRVDTTELAQKMSRALDEKFGKPRNGEWIPFQHDFNFYLNYDAISELHLNLAQVEEEAKKAIVGTPNVAAIFTSAEYERQALAPGQQERQILHTYFFGRSGDLILIPRPYFVPKAPHFTVREKTNHITGYNYDRTVPILFAGFHIRPGLYATQANVIDIAPTLTFLSGTLPPSLSEGRVLSEILTTTRSSIR